MEGDDDAAAAHPSGWRRPPSPRCCVLANRRQLTRQPPSSANRPVHGGCKLQKIVHTPRLQIPHYKRYTSLLLTTTVIADPTCAEIADCCSHLKIPYEIKSGKAYPRDFFEVGRVKVQLKRDDGSPINPEVTTSSINDP